MKGMKGKRRSPGWGVMPGVAALLPLAAGAGQGSDPALLRMKFQQGNRGDYRMSMQMTLLTTVGQRAPSTTRITMDTVQQQQVQEARPDGVGVVVSTVLKQQNSVNGKPAENEDIPPMIVTYDALGKVLDVKGGASANPAVGPLGSLFSAGGLTGIGTLLPTEPVTAGAVWTQTITLPNSPARATARCRLVRFEKVGRFRTARIRSLITVPVRLAIDATGQPAAQASEALLTARGTGTLNTEQNFAVTEGKLIRSTGSGTFLVNLQVKSSPTSNTKKAAQGGGPVAIKLKLQLTMGTNMIL